MMDVNYMYNEYAVFLCHSPSDSRSDNVLEFRGKKETEFCKDFQIFSSKM